MNIYQPYFYIIQDTRNGMYYAGCKFGNNSNPNDFMQENGYQTSSKIIHKIVKEFGLYIFIVKKLKKFNTKEETYAYETKFLNKINAKNNTNFYNQHNNDRYPSFGSEEFKKSMVEKYGADHFSKSILYKGRTYEEIHGEEKAFEIKKKMSVSRTGELNGMYSKKHKESSLNIMSKKAKKRSEECVGLANEEIFGKEKALEISIKISQGNKDFYESRRNKSYEEIFGKERADEIKKKIGLKNLGRNYGPSKMKGRKHSPETCEKNRINALNRVKKECPYCNRFLDPGNFKQFHGENCKLKQD